MARLKLPDLLPVRRIERVDAPVVAPEKDHSIGDNRGGLDGATRLKLPHFLPVNGIEAIDIAIGSAEVDQSCGDSRR